MCVHVRGVGCGAGSRSVSGELSGQALSPWFLAGRYMAVDGQWAGVQVGNQIEARRPKSSGGGGAGVIRMDGSDAGGRKGRRPGAGRAHSTHPPNLLAQHQVLVAECPLVLRKGGGWRGQKSVAGAHAGPYDRLDTPH